MSKYQRNEETSAFQNEIPDGAADSVILGIDGGATSTVCVCMPATITPDDSVPPVLARAVSGCSNHNSVGEVAAKQILEKVMNEALLKSGTSHSAVRAICLALSGVNHHTDKQRILDWLRDIYPVNVRVLVDNDAVAALASGTMGKLLGCVLIAGTGSIAYGFTNDGKEARAGGAGPLLGDWGSGFGIAVQALTAVVRAHDGRGPQTNLRENILHALDLSSPDELIGWTYSDSSWARIAALVPVVVSSAESGDEVANKILHESVLELVSSVKAVVQRLRLCGDGATIYFFMTNMIAIQYSDARLQHTESNLKCLILADRKSTFPLVMVGGVLESNKKWDIGKEIINRILQEYPGAIPIRPTVEPAIGAALLARNLIAEMDGDLKNRQCNSFVH